MTSIRITERWWWDGGGNWGGLIFGGLVVTLDLGVKGWAYGIR